MIFSHEKRRPLVLSRLLMKESPVRGDRFRETTGIRPSLHPTTINAIAEALKIRELNDTTMPVRVNADTKPLDVAVTAGKIAANAIERRQASSGKDNMQFTPEECHTVAGRVLGVIMRLNELERILFERVSSATWVQNYNAWDSFGVSGLQSDDVNTRIKNDPLFRMNRSECLLALFLKIVEAPQLAKVGQSVPDKSVIDFLDSERMEVLLADEILGE